MLFGTSQASKAIDEKSHMGITDTNLGVEGAGRHWEGSSYARHRDLHNVIRSSTTAKNKKACSEVSNLDRPE